MGRSNNQFKKMLSVFEYVGLVLKKYNEQQNQQNTIYRIIEIKHSSSNQTKIIFQIIGKVTLIESTPQEIMTDDRLLEGFSKKDIRAITYLACTQNKTPKYKIVVQEFCDRMNRILFKLQKQHDNEIITKSASEISTDKSIIQSLSQDDIQTISYIAGYEHSINEKEEMDLAKKNNKQVSDQSENKDSC